MFVLFIFMIYTISYKGFCALLSILFLPYTKRAVSLQRLTALFSAHIHLKISLQKPFQSFYAALDAQCSGIKDYIIISQIIPIFSSIRLKIP